MPHRAILALADDLTGALETGAKFARCPLPSLAIDTETRHLEPAAAADAIRLVARRMGRFAPRLIYKKTDSTLRGNIAAEFGALIAAWPERRLVYAPAYPQLGRTVRGGRLLVHGVPVDRTEFAADALNPVRTSDIRALIGDLPVTILDGETDADVLAAARELTGSGDPMLAAGPGAFAAALAACLGETAAPAWPRVTRCLVVNGSRHAASAVQISHASFDRHWRQFPLDGIDGAGLARALRAGERVRRELESRPVDALMIFGGDTAYGLHRALGARPFTALGEIAPGVPVSRCGGLTWITKAGGFGEPGLVCDIRKRLQ